MLFGSSQGVLSWLVLFLCAAGGLGDNTNKVDATGFFISKEDATTQTVTTTRNGIELSCVFKYATSATKKAVPAAVAPKKEEAEDGPKKTVESVLKSLQGTCASADKGFWKYEVCIGVSVTQRHAGETYYLGKRAEALKTPNEKSQKYTNGDVCAAVTGRPARQSIVTYACGGSLDVTTVSETSTCVYSLIVASPAFCGLPGFPKTPPPKYNQQNSIALTHHDENIEKWFLEITKYDGGEGVACAVYSVDKDRESSGSTLNFNECSLTLRSNTGHHVSYERHRARRIGRVDLRAGEMEQVVAESGEVTLHSTPAFTGNIQFLQVKGKVN
jgi:hypothetical protein